MSKPDFEYEPEEANRVWPDGTYPASIVSVQKKTSTAGNLMLELCIEAYLGTEKKLLSDYIVRPSGIWKLELLASAFDALKEFKEKTFHPKDYVDKSLRITVITKENPEFGKKNVITRYLKATDGDVPF